MSFFRDTLHLWILATIVVVGGVAGFFARQQLIPETYGDKKGRYVVYRAAALDEIKAQPSVWIEDQQCLNCHTEVHDEREGTLHETVACYHCHGRGKKHIEEALLAQKDDSVEITPAEEWDGDFLTKVDFFNANNRKACLVCHESTVGMPKDFKQIVVDKHLKEQEAYEVDSPEVCFECHGYHDTAP